MRPEESNVPLIPGIFPQMAVIKNFFATRLLWKHAPRHYG